MVINILQLYKLTKALVHFVHDAEADYNYLV